MNEAQVNRFQVHKPGQPLTEHGPDLLRKRSNAVKAALKLVPRIGLHIEVNAWDGNGWHRVKRADVDAAVAAWARTDSSRLSIAQVKLTGTRVVRALVHREVVPLKPLYNASPGTILAHSLIEHAFPGIRYAGAYVYPDYQPGGWSDHAWGTAVDETANTTVAGQTNDAVFSWVARMGQTGNLDYDYALGSKDGRVVQAVEPSFKVASSGADSSHLWHVHVSVVNHHGAQPPRSGGVW